MGRLRERQEWQFFAVLPRADRRLAVIWWAVLLVRGVLPALLAITTGVLVGAVQAGHGLAGPLAATGVVFVALQVLTPLHTAVGVNLGNRTAAWLNDRLLAATVGPPGLGHLEDQALTDDLTVARDFDLGITGPPLSISMDFIAGGLVGLVTGVASAAVLAGYRWWAPIVLVAGWASTHWLLRESGVWHDRNTDEVRSARRDSDYAYRLAVDPPAAKELRLFGLVGWTTERFTARRARLHELQYEATRLRERPVLWCLLVVTAANLAVLVPLAVDAAAGRVSLGGLVVFAQAAVGTSMIAFGGLSWALDGAAPPVVAVLRLESAMRDAGALAEPPPPAGPVARREPGKSAEPAEPAGPSGPAPASRARPAAGLAAGRAGSGVEIRFRDVTFGYPGPAGAGAGPPVLAGFDLTVPAGSSLAIVGRNGAGKTTLAKLLCRFYDPQAGAIEVDGTDLRALDLAGWRSRVTAVFQDFTRFELPLRDNVAPGGAPDEAVAAALAEAGAADLADLGTVLSRGYPGGTDLSGGQWQRVALARALCAVRLGAGLVLLDEPTAQLDVRGEAEIFDRILAATAGATTILISHRFSTVRHADLICVVEHGRVIELGSHDELIARGGRYREMFDLQARPFAVVEGEEEAVLDALA
jgi:ABC-type multidrug transport system fused ATPase/permease subunit